MLSSFREQKFTYLFKIFDFDHDGILQPSDFQSMAENIAIFRCAPPTSGIDEFIHKKASDIWSYVTDFLEKNNLASCNLKTWLMIMNEITKNPEDKAFRILCRKAVRDIFYIYDKNLDNLLSKQEYLCFFVALRVGIKPADFCFKTLDLNKDMYISRSELLKAIEEFLLSDETHVPGNMIFGNPEVSKFRSREFRM
jgi:hypothetical protein